MLELYQFESCPYCAKVRAKLTDLQIDYILRNAPKGSRKREFIERTYGQAQVPLLIDMDNDVAMYESADIIAYLEENYGS